MQGGLFDEQGISCTTRILIRGQGQTGLICSIFSYQMQDSEAEAVNR